MASGGQQVREMGEGGLRRQRRNTQPQPLSVNPGPGSANMWKASVLFAPHSSVPQSQTDSKEGWEVRGSERGRGSPRKDMNYVLFHSGGRGHKILRWGRGASHTPALSDALCYAFKPIYRIKVGRPIHLPSPRSASPKRPSS